MTACSLAHTMPMSNDFDSTMSLTARPTLAVRSMNAGTLPAPTPRAGLPHEYAARTMALPPVARMSATPGWFMSSPDASIDGSSIHWMQLAGAPAATAASRTILAAATEQFCADGWKPKTMGLRVFSAMSDLKIAVEVGFVTGVRAQMTPTGSAISVIPVISSWLMTPTVFWLMIEFVTCSHANMFFTALSSNRPRWVSSTAIVARSPWWWRAATDAFLTMWSTCSCVKDAYSASASCAPSTRASIEVDIVGFSYPARTLCPRHRFRVRGLSGLSGIQYAICGLTTQATDALREGAQ